MKIVSVVGFRKSGKTTTIEILVRELKRRGYTVGTVKNMHCPHFEIEENKNTNTMRHKRAGADVVCASAKGETTFIYNNGWNPNEIFRQMQVDYLISEGDYRSDVPRIICAHGEEEVPGKVTKGTFLVSGRVADYQKEVCGYPAVSAVKEPERLAQILIDRLPDTALPVTFSQAPEETTGFCSHPCKRECERNRLSNLQTLENREPRHIFLTGEKGIGKSTIWNKVLEILKEEYTGFRTCSFELNGEKKGYYMHAEGELPEGFGNDIPICVKGGDRKMIPVTEVFEGFGAAILTDAASGLSGRLILMDELGRMEKDAVRFQAAVGACLDSDGTVIGVLQKTENSFLESVKRRQDVKVIEVTKENREQLVEILLEELISNKCKSR